MLARKLKIVSSSSGKKSIYNAVKKFAQEGLNDLLRVLMESVDDALFELSDKVDNDRERNLYFEAMREIRLKRDGLVENFDYELERNFDNFINGKSSADNVDNDDELSLVELDDLEDNIAIENMISRARPHFEDELFAVTARLKVALHRDDIAEDENPLDPKTICDSFHRASDILETEIQAKLIFYKLFERYVMNNLGHFYKELNELFVQKGVLPDFKPDQERRKQTTRFMANRINQNSAVTGVPATPGGTGAPTANAAPGGAAAAGDNGNLFTLLQQAITGMPGGVNYQVAAPTGAGVTGGDVGAGGQSSAGTYDAGGYQPGGFIAALSNLQASSIPTQPLTSIDPQSFRLQTQQQLADFRQQHQHQASTSDKQTIDVVSMLFDFFFDDEALPAPIKVLIGRLQIPILKLAIIDKEFFNQKKHPARKLLDSISRASLGWGENHKDEKSLIDKTEQVVNYLINEFDQDISVFEKAYISFEKFVRNKDIENKKAEQTLRRQEEEKDQQIQQAQEAAAELIQTLIQGRDLSDEVADFLETTWTSVLFNAFLSLGETSNHWHNLKRISTIFVWTLIPKFTEYERSKIIKTIPALLRAMSKGMTLIKINNGVQNRIFKMLAKEHAKIVKQTSKNIVTRVNDETIWPDDNGIEDIGETQNYNPGDALDFEFSDDGEGGYDVIDSESADESITVISEASTNDVIHDLNVFTANVKRGNIKVDEEIILDSDDEDDFDELVGQCSFMDQAQKIEIGDWVEFNEAESDTVAARLSWKSKVTGSFVFVNRQGHKVRNLTVSSLAAELQAGTATIIQSSSVFDRAINTIISKTQH